MPRRRRTASGLAVVIGLAGVPLAALVGLLAFVLVPEVGLFGDRNDSGERVVGIVCALATGPVLVAGLLVAGVTKRDVSVLVPAAMAAAAVSSVVLWAAR